MGDVTPNQPCAIDRSYENRSLVTQIARLREQRDGAEAEVEQLREALEYERTHTLDDGTKHRVREALDG